MSRLLIKIFEYPISQEVTEEELSLEGRKVIIKECQDMIDRLEEVGGE